VIEIRPVDRHQAGQQTGQRAAQHAEQQADRQQINQLSQRGPARRAVLSRPWEQLNGDESYRWKQSYGGERSDSHRWLRFR
jgi:hypothetical protein